MQKSEKETALSLEKLIKQKELFIETLIHDLKTPLQAQITGLKLLKKDKKSVLTNNQIELIDIILESAEFMKEMLFSVLDIYKLENGVIKLNYELLNIDKLIQICVNELNSEAISKNVRIKYINSLQNPFVYVDKTLFRRVITNMLNNGIN